MQNDTPPVRGERQIRHNIMDNFSKILIIFPDFLPINAQNGKMFRSVIVRDEKKDVQVASVVKICLK